MLHSQPRAFFPSPSALRAGSGGFTLLEMLLVIALIALLTTVSIKGVSNLLSNGPPTAKQVVAQMQAAARRYALTNECTVRLSYSAEQEAMEAVASDGTELPELKLPTGASVQFLPLQSTDASGGASSAIFDSVAGSGASADLPYVTFYEDGTCTLYQLRITTAEGRPLDLPIDPWTGGSMLSPLPSQ